MVVGLPNPNFALPVTKLCITNLVKKTKFYVLYNPESYTQERWARYSETAGIASNAASTQFVHGTVENLRMELFFDTFSSGQEVGGSMGDKAKFLANSLALSPLKMDVRKYTSKIYDLMIIDSSTHVPPLLKIEWGSLQFKGHLVSCYQKFTKFNETGVPVRAVLDVTFKQHVEPTKVAEMRPNESPDTAKYRLVRQGDSLWALAGKEYGDCAQWRAVARANGLENPRRLTSGETIKLPAL
jgi:hypothetical protein